MTLAEHVAELESRLASARAEEEQFRTAPGNNLQLATQKTEHGKLTSKVSHLEFALEEAKRALGSNA